MIIFFPRIEASLMNILNSKSIKICITLQRQHNFKYFLLWFPYLVVDSIQQLTANLIHIKETAKVSSLRKHNEEKHCQQKALYTFVLREIISIFSSFTSPMSLINSINLNKHIINLSLVKFKIQSTN